LDDFCGDFLMPIYAYRCEACGFTKDVLQKVFDAPLTDCLSCGKSTFRKQLTAAGFQLKGTGWYATDFRGAGAAAPPDTTVTPADSAAPPANTSSSTASAITTTGTPTASTASTDGPTSA
jgi:putative FmdB family regulatory protein